MTLPIILFSVPLLNDVANDMVFGMRLNIAVPNAKQLIRCRSSRRFYSGGLGWRDKALGNE